MVNGPKPVIPEPPFVPARARLGFVICGVEHSGTTLVSDLFRQVPNVDSGFETGVLLASSPRSFPNEMPFADYILGGWAITQEELESCCDTESFAEFYNRLAAVSRSIEPGCPTLFDKTPRYFAELETCLRRADVPFVVTYKDPRAIVFSDYKRSGEANFDAWYKDYVEPKLGYMRVLYANFMNVATQDDRVLGVSLESLCMEPRRTCEAMFAHCGQDFRLEYLLLKNLRYPHTRPTITPSVPLEYRDALNARQLRRIKRHFKEFDAWFYD